VCGGRWKVCGGRCVAEVVWLKVEGQSLPIQTDDYHCGFGIILVATIAIILKNAITTKTDHALMRKMAKQFWFKAKNKTFIHFPTWLSQQPSLDELLLKNSN
jgi:hypothetical protein